LLSNQVDTITRELARLSRSGARREQRVDEVERAVEPLQREVLQLRERYAQLSTHLDSLTTEHRRMARQVERYVKLAQYLEQKLGGVTRHERGASDPAGEVVDLQVDTRDGRGGGEHGGEHRESASILPPLEVNPTPTSVGAKAPACGGERAGPAPRRLGAELDRAVSDLIRMIAREGMTEAHPFKGLSN
jgi:hypothetical protein